MTKLQEYVCKMDKFNRNMVVMAASRKWDGQLHIITYRCTKGRTVQLLYADILGHTNVNTKGMFVRDSLAILHITSRNKRN